VSWTLYWRTIIFIFIFIFLGGMMIRENHFKAFGHILTFGFCIEVNRLESGLPSISKWLAEKEKDDYFTICAVDSLAQPRSDVTIRVSRLRDLGSPDFSSTCLEKSSS